MNHFVQTLQDSYVPFLSDSFGLFSLASSLPVINNDNYSYYYIWQQFNAYLYKLDVNLKIPFEVNFVIRSVCNCLALFKYHVQPVEISLQLELCCCIRTCVIYVQQICVAYVDGTLHWVYQRRESTTYSFLSLLKKYPYDPYLKFLDFSQLLVADTPMKFISPTVQFTPAHSTFHLSKNLVTNPTCNKYSDIIIFFCRFFYPFEPL